MIVTFGFKNDPPHSKKSAGIINAFVVLSVVKYARAVEWLSKRPQPKHWRLERMQQLVKLAGIDYSRQKFVHVAGSNGKGSTCALIESILRAAGHSIGFYSSPHLIGYPERIRINGVPISKRGFARLVEWVKPFAERTKSSHFEAFTAMALKHFSDTGVEFVAWETGLGGRLDATNVVQPIASVITSVSLEHSEHLGQTVRAIAGEKAGIVKHGAPVITPCKGIALEAIEHAAKKNKTKVIRVQKPKKIKLTARGTSFAWRNKSWHTRLLGGFQAINACTALETARALGVNKAGLRKGLESVEWPGRMQRLGRFLLDGCHNPESARAFVSAVNNLWSEKPKTLVTGVLADKNYSLIASEFACLKGVTEVIAVESPSPRTLSAKSWARVLASKGIDARAGKGLACSGIN